MKLAVEPLLLIFILVKTSFSSVTVKYDDSEILTEILSNVMSVSLNNKPAIFPNILQVCERMEINDILWVNMNVNGVTLSTVEDREALGKLLGRVNNAFYHNGKIFINLNETYSLGTILGDVISNIPDMEELKLIISPDNVTAIIGLRNMEDKRVTATIIGKYDCYNLQTVITQFTDSYCSCQGKIHRLELFKLNEIVLPNPGVLDTLFRRNVDHVVLDSSISLSYVLSFLLNRCGTMTWKSLTIGNLGDKNDRELIDQLRRNNVLSADCGLKHRGNIIPWIEEDQHYLWEMFFTE